MNHSATELSPESFGPKDILMPEKLPRWALDRTIDDTDTDYVSLFPDLAGPIAVAAAAVERNGSVAIADIGCGTGNMLASLVLATLERTDCEPHQIRADGVNLNDHRRDSQNDATRQAIADGRIGYKEGRGESLPDMSSDKYDVVLSIEALMYSERPDLWLREMRRIGCPGATLFFTAPFPPRFRRPTLGHRELIRWQNMGDRLKHCASTQSGSGSRWMHYYRAEKNAN